MKRVWTAQELSENWSLKVEELALLKSKPGRNHLGFAIQLKYYQYTGVFPSSSSAIPAVIVRYVDKYLGSNDELEQYDWSGRNGKRHRREILAFLGIRRVSTEDKERLIQWLIGHVFPDGKSIEEAQEIALDWFKQHKVEAPAAKELERLLHSAFHGFEADLFGKIAAALSPACKDHLDKALASDKQNVSFTDIKSDPGRVGIQSVINETEKLSFITRLHLPTEILHNVHIKVIEHYRQRVAGESAWAVKRHPPAIRYGLLASFLYVRKMETIDGLIELLIQIIHRLSVRAEKKLVKVLLSDFRKVHGKTTLLYRIAEAALNNPDGCVKDIVFPVAGEDTLQNLLKEYKSQGPAYTKQVHKIIRASYSTHYRRMLPCILGAVEFQSNNARHRPVLDALAWLQHNRSSGGRYVYPGDVPFDGVIKPKWRDTVIEKDPTGNVRINRINYEICVLQTLREQLRCKEIWVKDADKFRNPDDDLPRDFAERRQEYYRELGHTTDATEFTTSLQRVLRSSLEHLDQTIAGNAKARILNQGAGRISISPLEAQPEPQNLLWLKQELTGRWPMTGLLDVLKEADLRIGFTDLFKNLASREKLSRFEVQKRLLLCLYGMGTNAGLKRVSGSRHRISYKELLHVRRRYIHKSVLRAAIGSVANAVFAIRNPAIWGEGTTACSSDSRKFGAWDQNLMTEWHIRYGGRGVMIYWHVEKKSICIYSQLKRCSSSEAAAMIEGVLRHCTDMTIDRQYVDSHGQSEVAFAFSHLLGFDLLPRLKAIASQKLYRPGEDTTGDYQNLQSILTRPVNWNVIMQQYDEMIKYTTALKQGTADPEAILRRFTRNNVQHPTYRALSELGKVIKTIFLCRYIESEALRQEIHSGLNVVENWNSANSFIFYGKGGEVATNRLEDQELSVLALHLLQICLVYVNTLMIENVLGERQWRDRLSQEDYRALTPLVYSHINPYGIFELDMSARLAIERKKVA